MRFLIVGGNPAVASRLQEVAQTYGYDCRVATAEPAEPILKTITQSKPELLAVLLSPDAGPGLTVLHGAHQAGAQKVFAVGPVADTKLRLRALGAGADHFLDEAEAALEMEALLRRISLTNPAPGENGRLISVLASSGGSGSSTIATNVAAALAKDHGSTLLIDLNLGAPDAASLLDLRPAYTLADLCRNGTRMDRAIFERCLVRHDCGVSLLSPSRSFGDIAQVTPQGVRDALTLALAMFRYVIVDLDDSFHTEQTQTLRQSDLIILVLRLDFTSLRNTQRTLEHLRQLQIAHERVRLVVNRHGQPQELPVSKAEEALGVKVAFYIPDDPKTINRANNNGIPAVLYAPNSRVSRSIFELTSGANGQKAH